MLEVRARLPVRAPLEHGRLLSDAVLEPMEPDVHRGVALLGEERAVDGVPDRVGDAREGRSGVRAPGGGKDGRAVDLVAPEREGPPHERQGGADALGVGRVGAEEEGLDGDERPGREEEDGPRGVRVRLGERVVERVLDVAQVAGDRMGGADVERGERAVLEAEDARLRWLAGVRIRRRTSRRRRGENRAHLEWLPQRVRALHVERLLELGLLETRLGLGHARRHVHDRLRAKTSRQ